MRFIINHKKKLWLDALKATEILSKVSGNGVVWSKYIQTNIVCNKFNLREDYKQAWRLGRRDILYTKENIGEI